MSHQKLKIMKSSVTVTVYLNEKGLMNLVTLTNMNLSSFNEEGHKKLFSEFPLEMYKNRVDDIDYISVQLDIDTYLLFRGYGLIR